MQLAFRLREDGQGGQPGRRKRSWAGNAESATTATGHAHPLLLIEPTAMYGISSSRCQPEQRMRSLVVDRA